MARYVYVDNSNVWIEGQRVSAVRKGLAIDIRDAMSRNVLDPSWRCDFGRLYELACPVTETIGRSALFGSRPPANDSLWARARSEGFEVVVHDRNVANREKKVDVGIATMLLDDSHEYMRPGARHGGPRGWRRGLRAYGGIAEASRYPGRVPLLGSGQSRAPRVRGRLPAPRSALRLPRGGVVIRWS